MNLLPKTSEEFSSKSYWDGFFKKRENNFEWYGEYENLIVPLHKYIKKDDKILVPGCGNSRLSVDLFDHSGFEKITNIDISEIVINQMVQQYQRTRPNLKYLVGDVTKMDFEDDIFTVVLDKGTLDALMTDDSETTQAQIKMYFDEISRVLRKGGRFLCISLLQEHILNFVLEYFSNRNFLIRIVRCTEAEEKTMETSEDGSYMPIFMIVATKIAMPMKIYEVCLSGDNVVRMSMLADVKEAILSIQKSTMIRNGLIKSKDNYEEIYFDLYRPGENKPRFAFYVLDNPDGKYSNQYGCFICPLGREHEWLFSTKSGRLKLLKTSQFKRLAIVAMHRDQIYSSLNDIKVELEGAVKSFAPVDFKHNKIPFLSLGDDIGQREIVFTGNSEFTGDFVVEDVTVDNKKIFRRLVFLNNKFIIQSEALLRQVKIKNKKQLKIDHGHLSCQHHLYMISGILAATKLNKTENKLDDSLIIGLGAGGLSNYITRFLKIKSTVVEIDAAILDVAKKYYELNENDNLNVVIEDGLQYLKNTASNNLKFKSILFDVDSKDSSIGISCPPPEFLKDDLLNCVKKSLTENGIFILNLVCRDESLKTGVVSTLKRIFSSVLSYQLDEDVNEIFYCHNLKFEIFEKHLKEAMTEFNNQSKQSKQTNSIDIQEFFETIKIN